MNVLFSSIQFYYCFITGICTVMPGSYKIFLQVLGVCLPYLVILFSYVMIIRKYKKSKNKVLGKSPSVKANDSLEASTSTSSRRLSLLEKMRVETTSFCQPRASLLPPRSKINEDDISDCAISNYEFLQRHRTERQRRRRKQEVDMTVAVLVTCLTFLLCNLPASILLILDPSASSFPEVFLLIFSIILSTARTLDIILSYSDKVGLIRIKSNSQGFVLVFRRASSLHLEI